MFQNITSLNLNLDLIHTITPAANPDATLVPVLCLPWVSEEPNLKVDRVVQRGLGWVCGAGAGVHRTDTADDRASRRTLACVVTAEPAAARFSGQYRGCVAHPPSARRVAHQTQHTGMNGLVQSTPVSLYVLSIIMRSLAALFFINNIIIIKTQFKG